MELEDAHSDLERKVKEATTILEQKEIALKHARADLEEKKQRWTLHDTNMTFMRTTDYVDIKEFSGVLKLLDHARAEYDEAASKAATLAGAVAHFKNSVAAGEAEIARGKAVLRSYGRVIPWRAR